MPFEIFQSEKNQQFYFRLKAGNGEIILQSEAHDTKDDAKKMIQDVIGHTPHHGNFGRKVAENGEHYFILISSSKDIVGRSELYKSRDGMENGIESVMKNTVADTVVKDLTA